MGRKNIWEVVSDKLAEHNVELRSRLAEVEKERDEMKASIYKRMEENNRLFNALNDYNFRLKDELLAANAANSYLKRRLDDATMESDAALAKLGNELFKVREELEKAKGEHKWGCGHTNHGSCSQCLGHVTNERNALREKLVRAEEILSHFSWTSSEGKK